MTNRIIFGGADTTPDAFSFTATNSAERNTTYTASTSLTGFDSSTSWSVSGGTGSADGSTFASSGTISPGQTFYIRLTSSGSFSSGVSASATIGGVSGTYTVTTRAADTTPNVFTFTDASNVQLSTVTSTSVTPTGYDYAFWSVTGGTGSIDGSTWATSGSITPGLPFYVRGTSSSVPSTAVNVTATIGGVSDIFTITTRAADTVPAAFSFTDETGKEINTVVNPASPTLVTGLEPNYSITVSASGGTVAAGTASITTAYGATATATTDSSGRLYISPRVTTSSSFSTTVNNTITIGGVSDTYSVTTRAADTTPAAFSFTAQTGATASTTYTSNTANVSGLETNYSITVSASGGTVDAGTSTLSGTFASSKTVTTSGTGTLVVAARGTSSATSGATVNVVVTIGTGSATYAITTAVTGTASYTSAGSYSWVCPAGVTSVCAVCVGASGGGTGTPYGGAGGLGYKNNIAVTPGSSYSVVVGAGGANGSAGGSSSFAGVVSGGGGGAGSSGTPLYGVTGTGGSYSGDGGGAGGSSPSRASISSPSYNGGAGAGGYSGSGGTGGVATASTTASTQGTAGSGGGGGGGSGARAPSGGGWPGGAGGGVGILGVGASGTAGASPTTGSTSASGNAGGAGSGGSGTSYGGGTVGVGAGGAVRIIWGSGRSFPSNAT